MCWKGVQNKHKVCMCCGHLHYLRQSRIQSRKQGFVKVWILVYVNSTDRKSLLKIEQLGNSLICSVENMKSAPSFESLVQFWTPSPVTQCRGERVQDHLSAHARRLVSFLANGYCACVHLVQFWPVVAPLSVSVSKRK